MGCRGSVRSAASRVEIGGGEEEMSFFWRKVRAGILCGLGHVREEVE